ncbi:MAG: hypothetical protein ABI113_12775, partial [Mucilaginibacter sp.]
MINFLQDNVFKLIFTTIAALIIGVVSKSILERKKKKKTVGDTLLPQESNLPTVNFYNTIHNNKPITATAIIEQNDSLARRKLLTKILFIDDDAQFKVINILQKSGWINTTLIKDIENIDDNKIKETDIFFVDIQGVGKELSCKDEGLG